MKKLYEPKPVKVEEVDGEGLVGLLGKNVLLFCANYFYAGKLVGVNTDFVMLGKGAGIVYETGPFDSSKFKDFQPIGNTVYVKTSAIESFAETTKF